MRLVIDTAAIRIRYDAVSPTLDEKGYHLNEAFILSQALTNLFLNVHRLQMLQHVLPGLLPPARSRILFGMMSRLLLTFDR